MNKENKTYIYLEILQGIFLLHFKLPKNEEIYEVKTKMDKTLMNLIMPKIPCCNPRIKSSLTIYCWIKPSIIKSRDENEVTNDT